MIIFVYLLHPLLKRLFVKKNCINKRLNFKQKCLDELFQLFVSQIAPSFTHSKTILLLLNLKKSRAFFKSIYVSLNILFLVIFVLGRPMYIERYPEKNIFIESWKCVTVNRRAASIALWGGETCRPFRKL